MVISSAGEQLILKLNE